MAKREINAPNLRKEMGRKASPLAPHNPFLDSDGLIRVGSRLMFAPIEEEAKFPILLPKGDPNVKDLIRQTHGDEWHAGAKHVLCQLRKRVWVLQGLQEVKKVLNTCVKCQKLRKNPCNQKMGVLPEMRVYMKVTRIQICTRNCLQVYYVTIQELMVNIYF